MEKIYTKTNWLEDGSTPINETRLNNLETQYDEAIAQAAVVRADSTKELRAEVVATLTGETPTAGRMVLNSDNGFFYGGNGSAWGLIGGGINIKSYQKIYHTFDGASPITDFNAEITISLGTAVSDHTKCIVLVHGNYPYNLGFTYTSGFTYNVPSQTVYLPFYAYMTDNNTIKLVPSYTEPDSSSAYISNISITNLTSAQRISTTLVLEILELDGAKNIIFAEKVDTNATGYYTEVTGITGITDYTKTKVLFQGGFALVYFSTNSVLEYKTHIGQMTSNTSFSLFTIGGKIGFGGGSFDQNRKAAYYIVETF